MAFTPQNPDFDRRVRESFALQQVMATLGIEIARLAPGEIELTMPYASATLSSTASCMRGLSRPHWTARAGTPRFP
jgi:acyl-coenzyme A thioesterase PaaI-like protein